jgi:hypothetical protein
LVNRVKDHGAGQREEWIGKTEVKHYRPGPKVFHVIDSTGVFYAEGAGHEGNLANNKENVKLKDLTL